MHRNKTYTGSDAFFALLVQIFELRSKLDCVVCIHQKYYNCSLTLLFISHQVT